jgi:hypothetical protein
MRRNMVVGMWGQVVLRADVRPPGGPDMQSSSTSRVEEDVANQARDDPVRLRVQSP